MDQKRQGEASQNEKIMTKRVEVLVIGTPHDTVHSHIPNNGERAGNEDHLHDGVVHRYKIREKIQIASQKHQRI